MAKTEWNLPVTVELDNGVVLGIAQNAEYVHNAGESPTLRLGAMKWRSGGPSGAGALAVTLSEMIQANEQLARELDAITAERDNLDKQLAAARRSYIAGMTALSNQHERDLSAERAEGRDEIEAAASDIRALKDERDELRARLDTALGYDTEQADRVAADIRRAGAEEKPGPWAGAVRNTLDEMAREMTYVSANVVRSVREAMGLPPLEGKAVARDTTNDETPVTVADNPAVSNKLPMPTDPESVAALDRLVDVVTAPDGHGPFPPIPRATWDDTVQLATVTMPDGTQIQAEARVDDLGNLTLWPVMRDEAAQRLADAIAATGHRGWGKTAEERLRTEIEELVLDYCGYVDGAEVSADGSADNDLADERRGAAMAFLDYVRGANVLTGAFRITERERGGWHVMPLGGPPRDFWDDRREWRVGQNYGIHIYAVSEEGTDEPVGTMLNTVYAQQVVADHNARL